MDIYYSKGEWIMIHKKKVRKMKKENKENKEFEKFLKECNINFYIGNITNDYIICTEKELIQVQILYHYNFRKKPIENFRSCVQFIYREKELQVEKAIEKLGGKIK